ncbi:MAG TPA: type III-B CRISPR module RAMP protein Cmr6 [Candidatus Competibacter sp.]|nr:type III-B CRISPR module RAMP protein Cmr6 [Candidatus Competibacter sp.]
MTVAAVPNYMGNSFTDAPPGHRFGLYFDAWDQHWKIPDTEKREVLKRVTTLNDTSRTLLDGLRNRQKALADAAGDSVWRLPAQSTAPFMTGLGNEHPLENGFAFLNPYGLPYLPGSGVKGVLRRAAEELALGFYGDTGGWDIVSLWWLFGFEPNSVYLIGPSDRMPPAQREEAQRWQDAYRNPETRDAVPRDRLETLIEAALNGEQRRRYREQPFLLLDDLMANPKLRDELRNRGALAFWDVIPEPASGKLAVDIMTPHYSHYYQDDTDNDTPHDSGQPNPILFLTVPPDSRFEFFVQCDPAPLPESLRSSWPILLEAAFRHTFDWLGFGAKTAVGYGVMRRDMDAEQQRRTEAVHRVRQAAEAALAPEQKVINELQRWFDEDQTARRKEPGGRLANRLNELLKEGLPWPATAREDLAKLAEAIYSYLDWGGGKKKQERKAKIQKLREGAP